VIVRVNLIQKFLLLNLFWHMAVGLYFGYWFSERLIDNVTRLHTTYLTDELQSDITRRFKLTAFDDIPQDPEEAAIKREVISRDARFLRDEVYPVQILWNRDRAVWANRPELIGKAVTMDPLMTAALGEQEGVAELESTYEGIQWMWKALVDQSALISDASCYLKLLVPISVAKETVIQSASEGLVSDRLKDLILAAEPGSRIVLGVLELKMRPQAILQRTVRTVNSVWKRVGAIYMLSNIVLFGLFKSAFNTIQRQARELHEQERLSHLGKMASYLAHEIRNPLFIIRGSAQTIEETSEESSPSRKLAHYVIDEVDRLNNMVQDLLGLVKPRLAATRTPTSLSQAVQDSVERSLKQAPRMELVPQLDPDSDLIWFNREQLIQVLTNLFRNSRDACHGHGTILMESRRTDLGNLQIRITDDGPGIPEENLQSIFDPFFSGKENGTGLGLAIVRHLVTGNNATIDAVKPSGTGACFILNVRLAPDSAKANGAAKPDSSDLT
jgi:signal transduction histidine kinase